MILFLIISKKSNNIKAFTEEVDEATFVNVEKYQNSTLKKSDHTYCTLSTKKKKSKTY